MASRAAFSAASSTCCSGVRVGVVCAGGVVPSVAGSVAGTVPVVVLGGTPMMPPMMGGPGMNGAGGGKERDLVTAKLTEDQAQLLGLDTQAEAVPGGTIARKES